MAALGLVFEKVRPRQGGSLGRDPGKEGEPYTGSQSITQLMPESRNGKKIFTFFCPKPGLLVEILSPKRPRALYFRLV